MINKVFGIGLSRTGTTSLHDVLEKLGFNSVHFIAGLENDPDFKIVDEYDALMDTPIPLIYQDLDKRFPNSKFILTTRNKEAWLTSMKWMFKHGKVMWTWWKGLHDYHLKFYGTKKYNESILSRHFDLYHENVKEYFRNRENDLLILNIDKGIQVEKICDFLNKPRVSIEFPKANVRQKMSLSARLRYEFKDLSAKLIFEFKELLNYNHSLNLKDNIKYNFFKKFFEK